MKEDTHVHISYVESTHETMKVLLTPVKMNAHNLHDTGEECGTQKSMVTCPGDLVMGPGTRVLFLWVVGTLLLNTLCLSCISIEISIHLSSQESVSSL